LGNEYVIRGVIEFKDGTPAKDVEVWLRSERGKVSTRIDETDEEGRFAFELPPPEADSYKILVYPYGIVYPNLAPRTQDIAIRVQNGEASSFDEFREFMEKMRGEFEARKGDRKEIDRLRAKLREFSRRVTPIREFAEGIEPDGESNKHILKTIERDLGEFATRGFGRPQRPRE
jgi:hypothetical protein